MEMKCFHKIIIIFIYNVMLSFIYNVMLFLQAVIVAKQLC